MTETRSYPHEDPRYGVAMTAGLGLFDTAGWAGVPMPQSDLSGGGNRRDYGPTGCVRPSATLLGLVGLLAALVVRGGRRR